MVDKKNENFLDGDEGRLAINRTMNDVIDEVDANDLADAARIVAEGVIETADQLGDAMTQMSALTKAAITSPTAKTVQVALLMPPVINSLVATRKFDLKFKFPTALAAGTSVSVITYDGVSKDVSSLTLEGLTSVYLSQLLGAEVPKRAAFSSYAGVIDRIVITLVGVIQQDVIVEVVISSDDFDTETVLAHDFVAVDTEFVE